MHPELPGDEYLDDHAHYILSAVIGVLVTEPMELPPGIGLGGHSTHGQWWWRDSVPADAVLEERHFER